MRAVVQRVSRASVVVDEELVGAVDDGLCVLVGVTHTDTEDTARALAAKIWSLRVLDDEAGVMNRAVSETTGDVLVVSQFTLYGDTSRGRRPSWAGAAPASQAEPLVAEVVSELRRLGATVATGRFGARMRVEIVNEGPVTLLLEI